MRLIALILPFALIGCTQFPELDSAVSEQTTAADYPDLVQVEKLIAQSQTTGPTQEGTVNSLSARVAALQNRAARMQGRVVDANTRQRMQNGVN